MINVRVFRREEIPIALVKTNAVGENLNERRIRGSRGREIEFRVDVVDSAQVRLIAHDHGREGRVNLEGFYNSLSDHGLVGWSIIVEVGIHCGRCNFDVSLNALCVATNG
jgi:hypothetical protein